MEFNELVKARYSCKNFDGRAVDKEQLEKILEADLHRLQKICRNRRFMLHSQRMHLQRLIKSLLAVMVLPLCLL